MSARWKNQRGYTLLEALISVGLLAGLASALGPAVYGSLRLSAAVLNQGEQQESLRVLDEALTQIFSNAVLATATDNALFMRGDKHTLRITSLAGEQSVARIFTLRIDEGALFGNIAPPLENKELRQTTELLPDGAVRFSYYGRASADAPPVWRDDWDGADPPLLVRVELSHNESHGSPVVLDYRPAGRAFLHCQFDPVSRRCRR